MGQRRKGWEVIRRSWRKSETSLWRKPSGSLPLWLIHSSPQTVGPSLESCLDVGMVTQSCRISAGPLVSSDPMCNLGLLLTFFVTKFLPGILLGTFLSSLLSLLVLWQFGDWSTVGAHSRPPKKPLTCLTNSKSLKLVTFIHAFIVTHRQTYILHNFPQLAFTHNWNKNFTIYSYH